MAAHVHPKALCESLDVGEGTRVWAFAHVLPGARIGRDCNICDHVFVENDVVVGDRVTLKCGVQLWDGITLEDDVFVGPNATFTNDRFPRSKQRPPAFARTIVRKGASIGANATVLPGVTIGPRAMIGAGAVVVTDVPANAIVVGNPARITGYVDAGSRMPPGGAGAPAARRTTEVRGVSLIELPFHADMRGDLVALEFQKHLPFEPKRSFVVFNVAASFVCRSTIASSSCSAVSGTSSSLAMRSAISACCTASKRRSTSAACWPGKCASSVAMICGCSFLITSATVRGSIHFSASMPVESRPLKMRPSETSGTTPCIT